MQRVTAADLLAEARRLMGGDARELPCGPFLLLTDVTGPLLERCPRLAGQVDRLYAERTGLEPVGGPADPGEPAGPTMHPTA